MKAGSFAVMRCSPATIIAAACLLGLAPPALGQAPALPDSEALYARIRERYRPMYERYTGVETRSRVTMQRFDSKTNELKESSTLITEGRDYFYKPREGRVLKYVKDGVEVDPSEARRNRNGKPMLPIWDADGPRHYQVRVVGRRQVRGQPCYALRVTPREKSERHFEGMVFTNAETLELVLMEGGMADVPFGVESVTFKADLKQQGDLLVYERFTMEARVDIPLLYPDVLFTSTSEVLESRGIPR